MTDLDKYKTAYGGWFRDFVFGLTKLDDPQFAFFEQTLMAALEASAQGRDAATVAEHERLFEEQNQTPVPILGERWGLVAWGPRRTTPRLRVVGT